jgi:hypothetical protein
MGMIVTSREDYPNAAASHAGSESIDEWMKKKYAIQQQEADTQQAEQLAKAPVYQAQAQYYGAEARGRNAVAVGTEAENKMNTDLYGQQLDTAKAKLMSTQLKSMAESSAYGSQINSWIQDRNQKTGESNPTLAQYGNSGLSWKPSENGLAVQPFDASNLYAEDDVKAMTPARYEFATDPRYRRMQSRTARQVWSWLNKPE